MGPDDALRYGVKNGDRIDLVVHSSCRAILTDLLVRIDAAAKLEVHIDTDEGNAVDLQHAMKCELVRQAVRT